MVLVLESVLRNGRIVCHNYSTVVNKATAHNSFWLRALMSKLVSGESVHSVTSSGVKKWRKSHSDV